MLWQSYYKTIIINDIIVFLLCNREFIIHKIKLSFLLTIYYNYNEFLSNGQNIRVTFFYW